MRQRKSKRRSREANRPRSAFSPQPCLLSLSIRSALRRPLGLTSALTLSVMLSAGGSDKALAKDTHALKLNAPVEQTALLDTGLVVIDPAVPNYRHWVSGVRPGFRTAVLDAERDGLSQLHELLKAYPGIRSVHLIAHGSPGALRLGNAWVRREDLETNQTALSSWFVPGPITPELIIYGCNVAQGKEGQAFVERLATLTRAEVAASEDVTGSKASGGDWVLEHTQGAIDSPLAFPPQVLAAYPGILASITVNTTNDVVDFTGAQAIGNLPGPDNLISLREAVIAANNTAGADTIVLGAQTYSLSLAGSNEDAALDGDLDITSDITIQGTGLGPNLPGQVHSVINATGLGERVLHVLSGASLTLEQTTVTGGSAIISLIPQDRGGGILNFGTAILTQSTVSGNSAFFGAGIVNDSNATATLNNSIVSGNTAISYAGGIFNFGTATLNETTISQNSAYDAGGIGNNRNGAATLTQGTVSENSAANYGGGIYNSGTVSLNQSDVSGNSANNAGGGIRNSGTATLNNSYIPGNSTGGNGGGIDNLGTARLSDTTLSGNSAGGGGGGIRNTSQGTVAIHNSIISGNSATNGGGIRNYGTTSLTDSIISGNSASSSGGGIYNFYFSASATATLVNSTVSGNSAQNGGGILTDGTASLSNSTVSSNDANSGGGINNEGTATLTNSLISGNTASTGNEIRNRGTVNAAAFNVFGYSSSSRSFGFTPGTTDIVPTGALNTVMDPVLADNGGPTKTHALLAGSSAIDAVTGCVNSPATDQRGVSRPQGPHCDVGAFEAEDSDGDGIADVNEIAAGRNPLVNEGAIITIINSILLDD